MRSGDNPREQGTPAAHARASVATRTGISRRGFLARTGAGAIALVVGRESLSRAATLPRLDSSDGATVSNGLQRFQTLPGVVAPQVTIDTPASSPLGGLVITDSELGTAQQGPLIIGQDGQIIWFSPLSQQLGSGPCAANVRVQSYQGQPVLAWWAGTLVDGHGAGQYEIYDTSYRPVATVVAQRGLQGDHHEFVLTPQGTALFTCYGMAHGSVVVGGRLRPVPYWYGEVQEVDVASGELLFYWRSDHHVALSESYVSPTVMRGPAWDYFHINAISVDPADQNLVISGRNTWACYKLDRKTGRVIWRLGGKRSDFRMETGTRLAFQHDVRMHDSGVMTVFDNGGGPPKVERQSKGLVLLVDERHRRIGLERTYYHDPTVYSDALGSLQPLGDGGMFIGWGRSTYFTKYGPTGEVELDGHLTPGGSSYRAFLQPWTGMPLTQPAVSVTRSGSDAIVHVSWNGATEVAAWGVLGGVSADGLTALGVADLAGLETAISVPNAPPYIAVSAYDSGGQVLGTSEPVS